MIDKLIKLANHLDQKGFPKEADYIDAIIKMANENIVFKSEDRDYSMGLSNTDSDFAHIMRITTSFLKYSKKLKNKDSLSDYEKQLTGFIAYKDNDLDFAKLFLTNDLNSLNDIAKCVFNKKLDDAVKIVGGMLKDCIAAGLNARDAFQSVGKEPKAFDKKMKQVRNEHDGFDYRNLCMQDDKKMKRIEEEFLQSLGTVGVDAANEIAVLASINDLALRGCRNKMSEEQVQQALKDMGKIREQLDK
jgi:hypothetical protein